MCELTRLLLLLSVACFHSHPAGPGFNAVRLVELGAGGTEPNTARRVRSRSLTTLSDTKKRFALLCKKEVEADEGNLQRQKVNRTNGGQSTVCENVL